MDSQVFRARFVADTVAEAIDGIERGLSPVGTIAQRLGDAVNADLVAYGWFDTRTGDRRLVAWPVAVDWPDVVDVSRMMQSARPLPHPHPVLNYWLTGNTGAAVVSTLVTDRAAWRNSEAYALLLRGTGCTESGGIRLDADPDTLRVIGVARHDDFSTDDVELIKEMWLPATALHAHADWLANIRRQGPDAEGALWRATSVGLTTREFEVLQLLATGLLASAIGTRLSISTRTVHRHLAHIYRKLGTSDRLTTVIRAQAGGLLLDGVRSASEARPRPSNAAARISVVPRPST
jgi:DNA-binding CsgD family transcriptional regulator